MAQVDFSWIAGLADPLIEAQRRKLETDALLAAIPGAADAPGPGRAAALQDMAGTAPSGPKVPTFAAIQGNQPSGKMAGLIASAAQQYGVDPNALVRVAQIESGLDPNAKNPKSSAGGLGQFINSTWAQYGGGASKFDPNANADALARLARDNAAGLRNAIGREPTPGELYLAHQQGLGGAIRLLQNTQARAVDVVGEQAVRLNGGTPDMTAGQFAALWSRKMGDTARPAAAGAQPPAPGGPVSTPATGPSPEQRAKWGQMIQAGGAPRALALQQIQAFQKPDYKFQELAGQVVRTTPKGGYEVIGNAPVNWQHIQTPDGKLLAFNPRTKETQVLDPGGGWRPANPDERKAWNAPENTGFGFGPGGKPISLPGTARTDIIQKGEDAFETKLRGGRAEQYLEMVKAGQAAEARTVDLQNLRDASRAIGQQGAGALVKEKLGPILEGFNVDVTNLSDIQTFQQTVSKLAPGLRKPGSGTTSDRDLEQFLKSLGSITANPAAREMAIDVFSAETQNEVARGRIAERLADKEITASEARAEISKLPKALDIYREFRRNNPTVIRDALKATPASAAPAQGTVIRYDAQGKRIQ